MAVIWVKEPSLEHRLRTLKAKFHVENRIAVSRIDLAASQKGNVRLGVPLISELVSDYSQAMKSGDAFPMVLLVKIGLVYKVLAGIHRINAAIALGEKTISAYVVETDDVRLIDQLARTSNRREGKRQDRDEAIQHARYMIGKYAITQHAAAEMFGLEPNVLSAEIRKQETRESLVRVQGSSRLTDGQVTALNLLKNQPVRVEMAKAAIAQDLTIVRTREVIQEVLLKKDQEAQMETLKKVMQKVKAEAPPERVGRAISVKHKLHNLLTKTSRLLEVSGPDGEKVTSPNQIQLTSLREKRKLYDEYRRLKKLIRPLFVGMNDEIPARQRA